MSDVLLDDQESFPFPSPSPTQGLIQRLQHYEDICLSSDEPADMGAILKALATHGVDNHYYMRITDADFQHLQQELERLSQDEQSVSWELIINREGIGFFHLNARTHVVLVDIELVGPEEEKILHPVPPDDPVDVI